MTDSKPLELSTHAFTLWRHPSVPEAIARQMAQAPQEWLWQYIDRPVKIDFSAFIVTADLALEDGPRPVALKRYHEKSTWKALLSPLRICRAMQCWQRSQALRDCGIATPEPLLAIRPKRIGEQGTCYLATEWIPESENLHLYLWRIAGDMALRNYKADQCARALGQMLGRIHRAGLRHRDLKAANLLVRDCGDSVATWLVDLDGLRSGRTPHLFERGHDLARLAAGMAAHPWIDRSVYARFLRAYGAQSLLTAAERKILGIMIERQTGKLVARKTLQGQRVL